MSRSADIFNTLDFASKPDLRTVGPTGFGGDLDTFDEVLLRADSLAIAVVVARHLTQSYGATMGKDPHLRCGATPTGVAS